MALGGPDTRLRMIAIKQQSGMPLTDKEIKRLAQRQSVEAMHQRNGWGVANGMTGAYNDASGHFQARSRANALGGIQAQYGDANVGTAQGLNLERLRIAKDNDLLHLSMNNSRSSMLHHDALNHPNVINQRNALANANIDAARLANDRTRFNNSHLQDDYDRKVQTWENSNALAQQSIARGALENQKNRDEYDYDNDVKNAEMSILQAEERAKNEEYNPLAPDLHTQIESQAIQNGDRATLDALKKIKKRREEEARRIAEANDATRRNEAAVIERMQRRKSDAEKDSKVYDDYSKAIEQARKEGNENKALALEAQRDKRFGNSKNNDKKSKQQSSIVTGGSSRNAPMNKEVDDTGGKTVSMKNNKPWLNQ
jgi:hypothetical protein